MVMNMPLIGKGITISIIRKENTMIKYTMKDDIKSVVANAVKGYQKGRRGVQIAAVNVLLHAARHGDYTQAQVLCEGVGNKSLVKWFEDFGGLIVNPETKSFGGWKGAGYITDADEKGNSRFTKCKAQMYWEYKAENIWAGHDDLKAAKALLNKHNQAVKHVENAPADAGKVSFHPALISALESAIAAIEEAA
jgi:hypothetical protein